MIVERNRSRTSSPSCLLSQATDTVGHASDTNLGAPASAVTSTWLVRIRNWMFVLE